ncbi:MAG TPA: YiiX family permuted papain-like enzyme [Lysobacter sp.]
MKPWPWLFALILCWPGSAPCAGRSQLRDGDIIFHTSRSSQSLAIQHATGSRYSHMGVIVHRDGAPYVFEAISRVSYTPLRRWIERGADGHYVVRRLRKPLSPPQATALRRSMAAFQGKPYDLTFEWSDTRIYCSELVWKLYRRALGIRIGELQRLRDFRLDDPEVRAKLQQRYGRHVPLQEPVISPAAMFDSPLLVTVVRR